MTAAERERLKLLVDARRRVLCNIDQGTARRSCRAISYHSGLPCRYRAVAGADYCRHHIRSRVAA
jgi:hypothetical protein